MTGPAAFVLSAGLGTRLAPLTGILPKPLVPVFGKPLVTFALDNLITVGISSIALNTHHLPDAFSRVFGARPLYREHHLQLFHEPLLLDTGGGICNARGAMGDAPFFLYNGDILADPPLVELMDLHTISGALATLLLRSNGGLANVRFDAGSSCILDMRGDLGVQEGMLSVYSGIAVLDPEIFEWIPPKGPYSIIDALLAAMRTGKKVSGMLSDGLWLDVGTPAAYLDAHCRLADPAQRPASVVDTKWPQFIHPHARVESSATLEGMVSVGPRAEIGEGAFVRDSVIWPDAVILPGAVVEDCIVSGSMPVGGEHRNSRGGVL